MKEIIGEKVITNVPVWALAFDQNGTRKNTLKQYIQQFTKYYNDNTAEEIIITETDIINTCKKIFNQEKIVVSYCEVPKRINTLYDYMNRSW